LYDEKESSVKGDYSCSRLFIIRQCEKIIALVEYQILTTKEGGTMILSTYSEEYDKAIALHNNLIEQLEKIRYELNKQTKVITKCPECSTPLPIEQADNDGFVICENCGAEINITGKIGEK
jgi:DNA-directed RNA polymerase subunit M/transcription elongation factor TFIIS